MALSSTTATAYISGRDFPSPAPRFLPQLSNSIAYSVKPRKLCIRNSGDASAETAPTQTDSESSIEVPEEPPSLISALNVERALRGIAITDVDHYGRLGIMQGCSYDQVTVAYKNKFEELLNQGLDEEELNKRLQLLKESYSILSSEKERRLYDWSLARSQKPEEYVWPFEVDITQGPSKDTPPPEEPEDIGPTRVVGYFLLGWLILGFTLSIVLNR